MARPSGRTVGQLRRAWADAADRLHRERAEAAAAAKRECDAAAAAARERRLDERFRRGTAAAWREVDALISQKHCEAYRKAVELMLDLKAVAARDGDDPAAFDGRVAERLRVNARRYALIELARKAGLAAG